MQAWMGRWRWAVVLLALALAACGRPDTREEPPAFAATIAGGTQIAFVQQGTPGRAPALVFQSGLGDDHAAWSAVLRRLPQDLEAIALDRPGYGASPLQPGSRDACRIAHEQRQLLRHTGVAPPYVLVGHSIGGLYQYVYARLFPEEVAGLVLLDPTHPGTLDTLRREQPGVATLLQLARHTPLFSEAMGQEFDAQTACLARIERPSPLRMPAVLLTSTRPPAYAGPELQAVLHGLHTQWLARVHAAALTPVADAGHLIHQDAPQAVVQAIRSVLGVDSTP